jgi:hypothetical protein
MYLIYAHVEGTGSPVCDRGMDPCVNSDLVALKLF